MNFAYVLLWIFMLSGNASMALIMAFVILVLEIVEAFFRNRRNA